MAHPIASNSDLDRGGGPTRPSGSTSSSNSSGSSSGSGRNASPSRPIHPTASTLVPTTAPTSSVPAPAPAPAPTAATATSTLPPPRTPAPLHRTARLPDPPGLSTRPPPNATTTSTSSAAPPPDPTSSSGKAKSCRECIRLKLKCSREPWPCTKCVLRGTASLCPEGQLPTRPYKRAKLGRAPERGDEPISQHHHLHHHSQQQQQQNTTQRAEPYREKLVRRAAGSASSEVRRWDRQAHREDSEEARWSGQESEGLDDDDASQGQRGYSSPARSDGRSQDAAMDEADGIDPGGTHRGPVGSTSGGGGGVPRAAEANHAPRGPTGGTRPSSSTASTADHRAGHGVHHHRRAASSPNEQEQGTLQLGRAGTSRYIGPGGHSFSLAQADEPLHLYSRAVSPVDYNPDPDRESMAAPDRQRAPPPLQHSPWHLSPSDPHTRAGTTLQQQHTGSIGASPAWDEARHAELLTTILSRPAAFMPTPGVRSPFSDATLVRELSRHLPPVQQARRAFQVYIWNVSWMYDPVLRLQELWEDFYATPFEPLSLSSSLQEAGEASIETAAWGRQAPQDPVQPQPQPQPQPVDPRAAPRPPVDGAGSTRPSSPSPPSSSAGRKHPHRLALIFSVLSLGVLFDVAPGARDTRAEHLYQCSWASLSLSNLNDSNTIENVQTLHLIGQYLSNRKDGRNADAFYPLLGTAVRSAIAMGLHRDAQAWKLPPLALEERRRVFWELYACDAFRSLAYGRPCNLQDHHVNAPFPQPRAGRASDRFHTHKFQVVRLLNRILDDCHSRPDVRYETILAFDRDLRRLWTKVPFQFGTPSWSASTFDPTPHGDGFDAVSIRLDDAAALRDMHNHLQAHTIAANVHQTLLHLHRSWFLCALQRCAERDVDPLQSEYMRSVVAVSESSRTLISISRSIYDTVGLVSLRWNFFWQHVFNAGICQCLYVLYAPDGVMGFSAWEDVARAVELLKVVRAGGEGGWRGRVEVLERLMRRGRARGRGRERGKRRGEEEQLRLVGFTSSLDGSGREAAGASRGKEAGATSSEGRNGGAREGQGQGQGPNAPGGEERRSSVVGGDSLAVPTSTAPTNPVPISDAAELPFGWRDADAPLPGTGPGPLAPSLLPPGSIAPGFPTHPDSTPTDLLPPPPLAPTLSSLASVFPDHPQPHFQPQVPGPPMAMYPTTTPSHLDWTVQEGNSFLVDLLQEGLEPADWFWQRFGERDGVQEGNSTPAV